MARVSPLRTIPEAAKSAALPAEISAPDDTKISISGSEHTSADNRAHTAAHNKAHGAVDATSQIAALATTQLGTEIKYDIKPAIRHEIKHDVRPAIKADAGTVRRLAHTAPFSNSFAAGLRDGRSGVPFSQSEELPMLTHQLALEASAATRESTHAEAFYLQKQVQTQTPMVFVLEDGERIEGYIEWYDSRAIKVRHGGRTLIYKSAIKYLYKANEV